MVFSSLPAGLTSLIVFPRVDIAEHAACLAVGTPELARRTLA